MKYPVIAFILARASRPLGIAALLCLSSLALAQEDPNLSRLLFEVARPDAALPAPPAAEEADAAMPAVMPEDGGEGVLARIDEYETMVVEMEETYGPFAHELSEQLQTLGALYEQAGNHESAIATYDKAVHILRVNNGLFTLEQTPLVQDIIRNYQAMNDFREADNRQEYLYYVKQKNYNDGHPEMIQAMFDWADWNVQAYYRQLDEDANANFTITQSAGPLATDFIPVVGPNNTIYYVPRSQVFGSSYSLSNSLLQPGMGVQYMMDPRLRRARDLYEEIAEQIESDAPASGERLPETERKLANISYIVKQEMDYMEAKLSSSNFYYGRGLRPQQNPEVSRGYVKGRDSLEKVLENLRADPQSSPGQVALAIIDLADWQLTFDRPQAAYDGYREAYQLLADAGMSAEEIDDLFAPKPALEIPTYATHRYSRALLGIPADAALAYRGYIDLRLDIDQYGNPRGPEVESESPNTPHDVREALLDHIRMAKLRPKLVEGEAVEQEDIVLRYYYTY